MKKHNYEENFEYLRENEEFRVYVQIEGKDTKILYEIMEQMNLWR